MALPPGMATFEQTVGEYTEMKDYYIRSRRELKDIQDILDRVVVPISEQINNYMKKMHLYIAYVRTLADYIGTTSGLLTFFPFEAAGPKGGGGFDRRLRPMRLIPGVHPQFPGIPTDYLRTATERFGRTQDSYNEVLHTYFAPLYDGLMHTNNEYLAGAIAMPPSASPAAGGSGKPRSHGNITEMTNKMKGGFKHRYTDAVVAFDEHNTAANKFLTEDVPNQLSAIFNPQQSQVLTATSTNPNLLAQLRLESRGDYWHKMQNRK